MTTPVSAVAGQKGASEGPETLFRTALRYGITASGPLCVSVAHFAASLIFLRCMPRADFGLFSFLLVVVPFCLSLCAALLGSSITSLAARDGLANQAIVATHFKAGAVLAAFAWLLVSAFFWLARADAILCAIFGAYGATMTLRWFWRSHSYARHAPFSPAASDLVYGFVLVVLIAPLAMTHRLSDRSAALALLLSAFLGLVAFGKDYLVRQARALRDGSLVAYADIWRDTTRWALLGVVLTEMTANVHSYLVTLISGPAAFALLAVGALAMRPVSLVFAALPDLERPVMARAIATGHVSRAFEIIKQFRTAVGAIWVVTVTLAVLVLIGFPQIVVERGYDPRQALVVTGIYAAVMAIRALRTPEGVLMQAACEFRALAAASVLSSIVAVSATFVLLLLAGPIASLGGILAGEALMASRIFALSRRWRERHV